MSPMKSQNAGATAFTALELLRENQQGWRGKITLLPNQLRVKSKVFVIQNIENPLSQI